MNLASQIIEHPWFERRRNDYIRWYPKGLSLAPRSVAWTGDALRGAYVHVPFCDRICKFCPYNKTVTQTPAVELFVQALTREVQLLASQIGGAPLKFVYFGGGTPSVLNRDQIARILDEFDSNWGLASDVEITLETHPTHATPAYLAAASDLGINRISIGIQSFFEASLASLGASHNEKDSRSAVVAARSAFENVAIDLLYSFQGQTASDWESDLSEAIEKYDIPHLSCYGLVPINSDFTELSQPAEIQLAVAALEFGAVRGFDHYTSCASGGFDISRSGFECRYETEHWSAPQFDFIGLGPGAFGFAGGHLTANRLSIGMYCKSLLEANSLPLISAAPVSSSELRNRYFVLGVKGLTVPLAPYREKFHSDPLEDFSAEFNELQSLNLAEIVDDTLKLTHVGRLYVDSCSALFFSESQKCVPHPEEPEIRALERLIQL